MVFQISAEMSLAPELVICLGYCCSCCLYSSGAGLAGKCKQQKLAQNGTSHWVFGIFVFSVLKRVANIRIQYWNAKNIISNYNSSSGFSSYLYILNISFNKKISQLTILLNSYSTN